MRKIVSAIFILLMSSCATSGTISREDFTKDGVDTEFTPYVKQFTDASQGSVDEEDFSEMDIQFADLPGNAVGMCYVTPFFRKVLVDRTWWALTTSQLEREELLFHEFGHCVLFRPHTKPTSGLGFFGWVERMLFKVGILTEQDGYLSDGCPSSFMHPTVIGESCISEHYHYYLEELFSNEIKIETSEEVIIEDFACKPPIIVNWTNTWTKKDKWTLNRAKFVCHKEYRGSCLHEFTKKNDHAYTAWCKDPEGNLTKVPYTL